MTSDTITTFNQLALNASILQALEIQEEDRHKPRVLSSQTIRRVDDYQTQLINRMRHGNMILAGQTGCFVPGCRRNVLSTGVL